MQTPLSEPKNLLANLKELIVRTLRLEDVSPEDIIDSEPLFGEGLGLDSIDALELVVAIEREYFGKELSSEGFRCGGLRPRPRSGSMRLINGASPGTVTTLPGLS